MKMMLSIEKRDYGRDTKQIWRNREPAGNHKEQRRKTGARYHQDDAGTVLCAEESRDKHGQQGNHCGSLGVPVAAQRPPAPQKVWPIGISRQWNHPGCRLHSSEIVDNSGNRDAGHQHPQQLVWQ